MWSFIIIKHKNKATSTDDATNERMIKMNQNQNQIINGEEIWTDIIITKNGVVYDYTGLYLVSNTGKVYSVRAGKVLKTSTAKNGYQVVNLTKNKHYQQFYVHRLVATAFLDNPNNLPQVNHLDECKSNNCMSNLEWVTAEDNVNHGTRTERQSMTCWVNKFKKGAVYIMKNKILLIDGNEMNVKTARVIVEDDGGIVLRFGFFKKETNFGEDAYREFHHIKYDEFDFDGVCVFHEDGMLVRFM